MIVMANTFLNNETIFLRAVEPEDLDLMYDLENDPEMWFVSSFVEPYSRKALWEYIEESSNDVFADKQLRLMIVLRETNATVGTIDLDNFDPRHSRAGVGIALHRDARGRGIAAQALTLLEEYAFRFLRIHQLYAYIPLGNAASLKLFETSGFRQTAVLEDWIALQEGYGHVAIFQKINR